MRNFKGIIAYDGSKYSGWQLQVEQPTIQGKLEQALLKITREKIRVLSSGRTDSGVHAHGQVIAFRTESNLTEKVLCRAINATTPFDMFLRNLEVAAEDFHPIRDATSKHYRYLIQPGPVQNPLALKFAWLFPTALDFPAMQQAAQHFVGKHDFTSFESAGSDRKTSVRHITELTLSSSFQHQATTIQVDIRADGFLYKMVRNIVGSLVEVGAGKHTSDWIGEVLTALDRRQAGMTAPAQGLYLMHVKYAADE
ncbi:MAG: tRNA pseudouridine(38-40) synthase TruA [Pirellulales bacterium]|jgi:tRNA pseudouridine38-40 synthase